MLAYVASRSNHPYTAAAADSMPRFCCQVLSLPWPHREKDTLGMHAPPALRHMHFPNAVARVHLSRVCCVSAVWQRLHNKVGPVLTGSPGSLCRGGWRPCLTHARAATHTRRQTPLPWPCLLWQGRGFSKRCNIGRLHH